MDEDNRVWKVIKDPDPCGLVGLTLDNISVGYMLKLGSFTEWSKVKHRIYGVFTAQYDDEPKETRGHWKKYQRMILRNGTYEARCNKHMGLEIVRIGE